MKNDMQRRCVKREKLLKGVNRYGIAAIVREQGIAHFSIGHKCLSNIYYVN